MGKANQVAKQEISRYPEPATFGFFLCLYREKHLFSYFQNRKKARKSVTIDFPPEIPKLFNSVIEEVCPWSLTAEHLPIKLAYSWDGKYPGFTIA